MYTIKLMLPHVIIKDKEFILKGNISSADSLMCVLFTEQVEVYTQDKDRYHADPSIVYGILIDRAKHKFEHDIPNLVIFEPSSNGFPKVLKFQLKHEAVTIENTIIMFYDQASFVKTEALDFQNWDNITMHQAISKKPLLLEKFDQDTTQNRWLSVSMFFQHLISYFNLIKWSITSSKGGKLVSSS